jgi:4-amino-4-deoxy-L-arabinose transferase-like glycosyltransferase
MLASAVPLIDPDEGRNAEVAREMLATGDWVIPRLAGMPYLDKPPALFWAEALAFKAFGVTPFAARVPAAVAAALILWMIGRLAPGTAGRPRALAAAILLATAPLFAALSAYVIFDMLLAACVTALWIGIARECADGPRVARRALLYAALAAGVLVKGPVMLAWGIGGSLAAALLLRSRAPLAWLAWWPGWAVFLALAGGWFALALARHPEYARYAFVDETFRRMTTGSFQREQPLWFVPAVLAAGALPWSLATPWHTLLRRNALAPASGAASRAEIASRVALGFVLFAAVFFTLSRSKLVTYLLPALPALAWIASASWADATRARRIAGVTAALYALLAAAALVFGMRAALWGTRIDDGVIAGGMAHARVLGGVFAALALAAVIAARSGRAWPALACAALFTPTLLLVAGPVAAGFARSESGAPLARAIAAHDSGARVRYEYAYSPGTDFLLGRGGWFVTETGHEFTSNYQIFYMETLIGRGLWVPSASPESAPPADVIVRPARRRELGAPEGWVEFHRDRRFVAYRPESDSR